MIIPLILCGGSGTRLWPLSRRTFPKQLVSILGERSLLQQAMLRVIGPDFATPIVIACDDYRFMVSEQIEALGLEADIVLEPEGRDTLPAIVAAAILGRMRDPDASVLVMPSDHLIADKAAFQTAAGKAADAAAAGNIVALGLTPTRPAVEYGYVRPGADRKPARHIDQFLEKPDSATAERLIAEGCLWNAGIFCFRSDTLLAEASRLEAETVAHVETAVAEAWRDLAYLRLGETFRRARKISFDYAVMEKTDKRVVVPVTFSWSDVGNWRELWSLSEKDSAGNAITGDVRLVGVANSYVRADSRLVCVMGLEGLAVIDTTDALLIAPLEKAQEVKALVGELDDEGRAEATIHSRVYRPWGWYQTIDRGDRFLVKRICVSPGRQLSLQRHFHRAEHWVVVEGTAEVQLDDREQLLRENESIYIPMGGVHRLTNPGRIPVELIEVQTGAYLEEDDIVRLEDNYGRS